MSKKIVLVMVLMLSLAGIAQAYTYSWCSSSGDWGDIARWDVMPSPTQVGQAIIDFGHTLDVTTAGQGGWDCVIGYDRAWGGSPTYGTVNIAAGIEWTVNNGYIGHMGGIGILNINGTAHVNSNVEMANWNTVSSGTVNVNSGGAFVIMGTIDIGKVGAAAINLKGSGSMVVDGGSINLNSGRGHIDIESGQLKVKGDCSTQLQSYINNGWITSRGGYSLRCFLVVSFLGGYTYVKTDGCTCVTYLPEDLNHDCYVDFQDIAILAQNWLICTNPANADCL